MKQRFCRATTGDARQAEARREVVETPLGEGVADARRAPFVPVFPEDARGEARAVPGFGQADAACRTCP